MIRKISRLFHISGEEAPRIIITTKNVSESEIKKFEKDIEKTKNEDDIHEKTELTPRKPPDQT